MPYKKTDVNGTNDTAANKNSELKQKREDSKTEFQVLSELTKQRKEKGLTQTKLARKPGNKQ